MSIPKIIVTVIQLLSGLFLIAVVLLQSGKSAGLSGAIAGGMDTFMAKNKAKTWDAKLAKWTKWVAILFMVLTLVLSLIK
ncbi:preprotein translocase subunit SecG [Pseudoflavonifractor intestinihominis]